MYMTRYVIYKIIVNLNIKINKLLGYFVRDFKEYDASNKFNIKQKLFHRIFFANQISCATCKIVVSDSFLM